MIKYIKGIWSSISTTLVGMKITLKHSYAPKVTNQYPEKFHPIKDKTMPENSRNKLHMDAPACTGCGACARVCPVDCIFIETIKSVPGDDMPDMRDGKPRKMWVSKFDLDHALCCFCGLCTDVCPTDAIVTTQEFEYSTFHREDLLSKFSDMTPEQVEEKKQKLAEFNVAKKKAAAEKKAAEAKAKEDNNEQ